MSAPSSPVADAVAADPGGHQLERTLENAPTPFAITDGRLHTVIYANRSFRELVQLPKSLIGTPILDALRAESSTRLGPILDRALENAVAVHDHFLGRLGAGAGFWTCSIWPSIPGASTPSGLTVELRMATHLERSAALQREVAERLLLSALRESEAADAAHASRGRMAFLVDAGRRLGSSLNESVTRETMAGVALPALGAWCIVDLIEPGGAVTRLAVVHPDPEKQELARRLTGAWIPQAGDSFGAPAVARNPQPIVSRVEIPHVQGVVAGVGPDTVRLVDEVVVGPLLTVPLISHGKLLGAVTFVSGEPDRAYTPEEIDLAESLAARSADALNSARLYGEALLLRDQADASNSARMRFLGNISHELRTPLNAISGYAQLMEQEVHGPITPAQRRDLERIRLNQEHVLVLITDVLNFVRTGLAPAIEPVGVPLLPAITRALGLLEGLADSKSLHWRNQATDAEIVANADPDRLQQILINLISNSIKFTPSEGTITLGCEAVGGTVHVTVADTGVGISPEQREVIFEPFVQIDPKREVAGGVGLGLAISRDLARAMRGDITVESTPGRGSCFTVTLPRHVG